MPSINNQRGSISIGPSQAKRQARNRTTAAAPKEKPVKGLTLPDLPEIVTHHLLTYLDPTELAKMMGVNRQYNKAIKNTPSLYKEVQHRKYLILAKQTAERIQDDNIKSKAYCAIATIEAKSNSEAANQTLILAKQTAERIHDDYMKSKTYCAIATEEAKLNPEEANQTWRLAKEATELIQRDDFKSTAYCAIATEEAK